MYKRNKSTNLTKRTIIEKIVILERLLKNPVQDVT